MSTIRTTFQQIVLLNQLTSIPEITTSKTWVFLVRIARVKKTLLIKYWLATKICKIGKGF